MAAASLGWLAEACLRACLLLAIAYTLESTMRRAPARARHLWWASALAGALAMAPLSPALPSWHLPILPSLKVGAAGPDHEALAFPVLAPAEGSHRPLQPAGSGRGLAVIEAQGASSAPPASRRAASMSGLPVSVAGLVLCCWAIGSVGAIGWLLCGLWRARELARRALPVEGQEWDLLRADLQGPLGPRGKISILASAEVDTPVTWGWLRPVVLMPLEAGAWCQARRRLALAHEMAHVRRRDWLAQILAHAACSAYWFVPVAWMARRRMRLESEKACDEAVLDLGTKPSEYAAHLLAISESVQPGPLAAVATLATRNRADLEARIMSILSIKRPIPRNRLVLATALAVMAGLVLSVSSVIPWAEPRPAVGAPTRQRAPEAPDAVPAPSAPEPAEAPGGPAREVEPAEPAPEAAPEAEALYLEALAIAAASTPEAPDGDDRWITWADGDLRFAIKIRGSVDLDEDGRIVAMTPASSVVLEAAAEEHGLRLEITEPEGGTRVHEWVVNGRRAPFDQAASRWMTAMLAVGVARDAARELLREQVADRPEIEVLESLEASLRAPIIAARLEKDVELKARLAEMVHRESSLQGRIAELRSSHEALRAAAAEMRGELESLRPLGVTEPGTGMDDGPPESRRRVLALEDRVHQLQKEIESVVEQRSPELVREMESLRPQLQILEGEMEALGREQNLRGIGDLSRLIEMQKLHERAAALAAMAAAPRDERDRRLSEELRRLTREIILAAGVEL